MQEFFGDFVVMDPQHFCIPIARTHVALQPFNWNYADATEAVARMTEGLASLTLSMRRRFSIRQAMLLPQSAAVGCQSGYLLGGIQGLIFHACSEICKRQTEPPARAQHAAGFLFSGMLCLSAQTARAGEAVPRQAGLVLATLGSVGAWGRPSPLPGRCETCRVCKVCPPLLGAGPMCSAQMPASTAESGAS